VVGVVGVLAFAHPDVVALNLLPQRLLPDRTDGMLLRPYEVVKRGVRVDKELVLSSHLAFNSLRISPCYSSALPFFNIQQNFIVSHLLQHFDDLPLALVGVDL